MIVLLLAALTTALSAGLFFSWSCSVTLGLARLPDTTYIPAMQSINREILNPVFFTCFFGPAILLPLSTFMHYGQPLSASFWSLLAAAVIYLAGVICVTIFGNVPLNNALDAFNLQLATKEEIASLRAGFEAPWNSLNTVRTVASTISLILVLITCLYGKECLIK